MAKKQETKEDVVESPEKKEFLKFCPICGTTMTKRNYLGGEWWFCDDAEGCGFLEPVK